MDHRVQPFTLFVLLKALPAWLALPQSRRRAAFGAALVDDPVSVRHFDAEAFTAVCTEVAVFVVRDVTAVTW